MKEITKSSLVNGLSAAAYVILIASLIYTLSRVTFAAKNSIIIPIAMLMLFVFSAAFTGILVFGKPIMWYLNNKKKEAISLLFYTLGVFFIITLVAFVLLFVIMG